MAEIKRAEITSRQLAFSLNSILIGVGILSISRVVAEEAGQDGWIAVIVGSLPPLLGILSIIILFRRFPGYNFFQICQTILGKYLGRIPLLIYIIYGIIFCSEISRLFSDLLDTYILIKTPRYIKMLIVTAISIYIVMGGIKVIARFNELSFFVFLPLYLLILPPIKEAEWTFLLPVASTPVSSLLSASFTTSMAFAGFEYLLVLYPFVNKKTNALKYSLLAFVIVLVTYIYVTVLGIISFGPYMIRNHIWPVLVLLKIVDVPVVERLEFFFIALWVGVSIRPVMNQHFAVSYFVSQVFGIKEYRKAVIPVSAIFYILAILPENISKSFMYATFIGAFGMLVAIVLPAFLTIMSVILKKGGKTCD